MHMNRTIVVAGAVCVAGLAVAGIASGLHRAAGTPSAAPDIRGNAGSLAQVAQFASEDGRAARQVVLQRTPDGYLCVWDSPDGTADHGVGGCNPADDPLAGHKVFVSLAYDGGPAVTAVHDARLSGLAAADVASARLVMTDGSTRPILLSPRSTRAVAGKDYRPFAYRMRQSDLESGVGPVAVLVLDARGKVIDRQATGIG
jgi:hypothetical protein